MSYYVCHCVFFENLPDKDFTNSERVEAYELSVLVAATSHDEAQEKAEKYCQSLSNKQSASVLPGFPSSVTFVEFRFSNQIFESLEEFDLDNGAELTWYDLRFESYKQVFQYVNHKEIEYIFIPPTYYEPTVSKTDDA
jgi:hypothetical protein